MIAAADFKVPHATTAADVEYIGKLLKIGGGFGMLGKPWCPLWSRRLGANSPLGVVCGWYLALLTVCEAVGIPLPLPVFDLSSKVFPAKDATKEA